jgi:hypothetical protein
VVTAQQAQLVLSYGASLLRRRDARLMMLEEARDEVAIALAGRAEPVFGFVATEKEVCEVQSKRGASTELRGSINGAVALMGG